MELNNTDSQNLVLSNEWPKYGFLAASSAVLLILTTLCFEGARSLFFDDNFRFIPYIGLEVDVFSGLSVYCYQALSTLMDQG